MLARGVLFARAAARSISTSTLPSGLRVVTDNVPRAVPSVSVSVGGGSSAVDFEQSGVAHLFARAAFMGTSKRTALRFVRDAEDTGSTLSCIASRDDLLYTGQTHKDYLDDLVHLLAEAVQAPRFRQREVEELQEVLAADAAAEKADPVATVVSGLHSAAFREKGLGLSVLVPEFNLHHLGEADLLAYHKRFFNTGNVVVAASGVEHESFVELVQKAFSALPSGAAATRPESKYVGGEQRAVGFGESTIGIAFPGAPVNSASALPLDVLAAAVGDVVRPWRRYNTVGGGANTVLGKLATNAWLLSGTSFAASYAAGGLFGVVATAPTADTGRLVDGLVAALKKLPALSAEDVQRAKARLALRVLAALESPAALSADLARQMQLTKAVQPPASVAARIQAVSAADVTAAAKQLLTRPPTVVVVGKLSQVPAVSELAAALK